MPVTILHISDLHRDPTLGIHNDPLLRSLVSDRDRYEPDFGIGKTDVIVVSGDIVYGVKPGASAQKELTDQYAEAEEFLVQLCNAFVNGNRERLILIPGNHDVCFPHFLDCLQHVPLDPNKAEDVSRIKEAMKLLHSPTSSLRLNSDELKLYEITDHDRYAHRLDNFCELYDRFYLGKRKYTVAPEGQFDIFDYPELNLTFAALNSCHNNDPYNRIGSIYPDALARVCLQLDAPRYAGRLRCAIWHHNTSGGPSSSDYMDNDVLQLLIDAGFSIGFHGHQHRPDVIDERVRFGTGRKITVISAGTLCGGEKSLPHGHDRSYNVLQVDPANYKAKLYQRRMGNDDFRQPVWTPGFFATSLTSYVEFDIQPPVIRKTAASPLAARLAEAERLVSARDYPGAKRILLGIAGTDELARRLLLACYAETGYDGDFVKVFYPPTSTAEAVNMAAALHEMGDKDRLRELLSSDFVAKSAEPAIIEIRERYTRP